MPKNRFAMSPYKQPSIDAGGDHTDQIDGHSNNGCVDALVDGRVYGPRHIASAEEHQQRRGGIDDDADDIGAVIVDPDLVGHHVAVLGICHQGLQDRRESVDEGHAEHCTEDDQHGLAIQGLTLHDVGQRQHDHRGAVDLRSDHHDQRKSDVFSPEHQVKGGKGHTHSNELAHTVLHPGHIVRGSHEQKDTDPEICRIPAEGVDHAPHLECCDDQKELPIVTDAAGLQERDQSGETGVFSAGGHDRRNVRKGRRGCAESSGV